MAASPRVTSLHASAALHVVLRQPRAEELARSLGEARLVLAPDLYAEPG